MAWVTLDEVRAQFPDAPLDDDVLTMMVNTAHEQVSTYAPPLPVIDPPAPAPDNYRQAEIHQVIALWQNGQRDGDVIGFGDGFAVRARPLSAGIKAMLRPPAPVPRLG